MKMSDGIEWAIHCCSLLAVLPEGAALPVSALAEFFDVPQAYLAKHLQHLSRAEIVTSARGPGGGYSLARTPQEISLLDIVEAIDGRDPCFRCTEIRQRGPSGVDASHYLKPCGIAVAMLKAERAWRNELARVSIQDMTEAGAKGTSPAQLRKATEWLERSAQRPKS